MMTEFQKARELAGLTVREAAALCRVDDVTVRRWEMNPKTTKTSRNAPPLAIAVLAWYAQGVPPSLPSTGLKTDHHP